MYELAKDITFFEDDGSCPKGFGWARHDQTLFSVFVNRLGMEISNFGFLIKNVPVIEYLIINREITEDMEIEAKKHLKYKEF